MVVVCFVGALVAPPNDKSERWRRPTVFGIADSVRPPPSAQLTG